MGESNVTADTQMPMGGWCLLVPPTCDLHCIHTTRSPGAFWTDLRSAEKEKAETSLGPVCLRPHSFLVGNCEKQKRTWDRKSRCSPGRVTGHHDLFHLLCKSYFTRFLDG